ncbi:SusD/RagB family nutrient-binding outer membrane lipoprotein [Chryseolinea soli]|uniref:SusD/RagB family nutrient-binding outer membrane lipoprotein n=1 Tax=Chryseolinea soli TaxID=2321403 RepID=A0A385SRR3_9BACT|nr:SusD/RagB family nutrient-binding outer membrane lipoprotein [Chryseolinea soli]AYB32991.1 SusD/RagB family nutrient-binding outer membrane lipoprotein [Chryseolinea soli]
MNLQKYIAGIIAAAFVAACATSCQDRLEEQYQNPEKTTNASIDKFFTKMLDNRRVRADYWNIRTLLVMHPAVYTNIVSYPNTPKRYQEQLSYLNDYWKDYFTPNGDGVAGIVPHMREIEKQYATLSAEDKVKADVFLNAARIVYYDQTSQVVDLFGDIPFSEAGMLNLTGETKAPKFDSADEIYNALIAGLKESAAYFATASLDPLVASSFGKQDMLLQGSLDKWERYANSIRLRLLMRISFQNEQKAKTEILEMLNAPGDYPLVDETTNNILLSPLTTYTDYMRNAVTELESHLAPEYLMENVLRPANDPRIRVLFDKNVNTKTKVPNADYYSMPANIPSTDQETNIAAGKYAVLDSTTFMFNTKFPGIVITAAEVNFIRAEAFERWGSTAQAQTAYEKAVKQAVDFVFYLNNVGATFRGVPAEDALTPTEVSDLLASATVAYTGTTDEKLAKIWTQKWVDFGFMQSIQGWSEVRRTKYPQLTFVPDTGTPGSVNPPSRLLYPDSEKVYNATNYESVQSKDTRDTKIFWDVH